MTAAVAPMTAEAAQETGALSTRYDCLFQTLVGGPLMDGELIAPDSGHGAATLSRVRARDGFPAARSDQGWYDGILSVGPGAGLCQTDNAG